jgi:hypothetical protein
LDPASQLAEFSAKQRCRFRVLKVSLMAQKKLSVIIVTWNSQSYIENCLYSVYQEVAKVDHEIFVVDNASADRTVEIVKARFPEINFIHNDKNLGFAAANNQALAKSTGALVLLFNPDAVLLPGTLAKMMAWLEQNPGVGMVGPKILNEDGSVQLTCARRLPTLLSEAWKLSGLDARFPDSRIFGRHLMSYWDHQDSRFVELISGACMLIRCEVLQRCGPLDDRFFFMYEDVEFCHRVLQNGYKIYYLADAAIKHLEGRSRTINLDTLFRTTLYNYQSMMQYYEVTRGRAYAMLVRVVIGVGRALLLVKQFLRWLLAHRGHRSAARKKLKFYYMVLKQICTEYKIQ